MPDISNRNEFPEDIDKMLSAIGTSGYTAVINYTRVGAEFLVATYPQAWLDEYDEKGYMWCDPVLMYSVMREGDRRWSDCKLPDLFGVMKSAAKHGLGYGACFTRFATSSKHKCMLSVARDDREITDEEMTQLSIWFTQFVSSFDYVKTLTKKEEQALKLIGNGFTIERAALKLLITRAAMKSRLAKCRDKLEATTNAEAVAKAIARKLI